MWFHPLQAGGLDIEIFQNLLPLVRYRLPFESHSRLTVLQSGLEVWSFTFSKPFTTTSQWERFIIPIPVCSDCRQALQAQGPPLQSRGLDWKSLLCQNSFSKFPFCALTLFRKSQKQPQVSEKKEKLRVFLKLCCFHPPILMFSTF